MIDLIDSLKLGARGVGRSPKRVRRMGAAKCCSDPAGAWRRQASRKFGLSEAGCVELGRLSWPSRRSKFACTMATLRWRRFFRARPSVNGGAGDGRPALGPDDALGRAGGGAAADQHRSVPVGRPARLAVARHEAADLKLSGFPESLMLPTSAHSFLAIGARTAADAAVRGSLISLPPTAAGATTIYQNHTIDLSGGSSATPSAAGLIARATLTGRGCTVKTN